MYLSRYMTPDNLDDVRRLAHNARGFIDHVYLHWTAGWYGQCYDSYHICIDKGGEIYLMCDNSLTEVKVPQKEGQKTDDEVIKALKTIPEISDIEIGVKVVYGEEREVKKMD